jgi:hypothetical protein
VAQQHDSAQPRDRLRAYPLRKCPINPANLQHIRETMAQIYPLSHNVMRHPLISMFVAHFRASDEATRQANNWESIIRRHPVDLCES